MQDQEIKITTHPSGGIKIKEMENTLIDKLKAITPSDFFSEENRLFHEELITLAPQMRTELIRMDEEMRELKAQLNLAEIYITELKDELKEINRS